jgi:PAS domain S-box-containing protein
LPAWLWQADARRIIWANPVGAAIFGAATSAAIGAREFDADHLAAAQIARLAAALPREAPPRLERLRGFGGELGCALTCACSHVVLRDGALAILVAAAERAGPDLTLNERIHRLLAGSHEPVAVYSAGGQLLCATQGAHAHLCGATSLAALGAQTLAASALATGRAIGNVGAQEISIDRLGGETATVLVVTFAAKEKIALRGPGKNKNENIVPFPSGTAEVVAPALTPLEHMAFRELSRKLTQGLAGAGAGADIRSTTPPLRDDQAAVAEMPPLATASDPWGMLEPGKIEPPQGESVVELRSILEAMSDGVVLIDRQGTILSASRGAQALLGSGSHALAGRTITELLSPESTGALHDYLADVLADGRSDKHGREVIGREREGRPIALSVTIAAVADGKEKLCVAFRDITQWKETERALVEARQRAETASSAKSDFLAKISHEIRTPLNSIIGFSEVMLAEQFGRIGNERYREYLKDIHASGGHLLSLINDLLDLSKIEAGKLELAFTGVALNDLMAQCVATMAPQANRGRIIIRTALAPALPAVLADARSVRQIVLNLLSNSLKFTPPGGQVIVSTASNGEAEVVLRVRDTGVGMSEQDIVTALEPFQQLATSPRGGTGLGLPLTKAMAEANRAKFQLTSTPKEGTLVEITFPASSTLPG